MFWILAFHPTSSHGMQHLISFPILQFTQPLTSPLSNLHILYIVIRMCMYINHAVPELKFSLINIANTFAMTSSVIHSIMFSHNQPVHDVWLVTRFEFVIDHMQPFCLEITQVKEIFLIPTFLLSSSKFMICNKTWYYNHNPQIIFEYRRMPKKIPYPLLAPPEPQIQ